MSYSIITTVYLKGCTSTSLFKILQISLFFQKCFIIRLYIRLFCSTIWNKLRRLQLIYQIGLPRANINTFYIELPTNIYIIYLQLCNKSAKVIFLYLCPANIYLTKSAIANYVNNLRLNYRNFQNTYWQYMPCKN